MIKEQRRKLLAIYAVFVASLALSIGLAPRLAFADEAEPAEEQQVVVAEGESSDTQTNEAPAPDTQQEVVQAPVEAPAPASESAPAAPEVDTPSYEAQDAPAVEPTEPAVTEPAVDEAAPEEVPQDVTATPEAAAAQAEPATEKPAEADEVKMTASEDDPIPVKTVSDGLYEIRIGTSGSNVATVSGSSKATNVSVVSSASTGSAAQKFFIEYNGDGYYNIYNLHSGKKLTVDSSNNIIQATADATASQFWAILANASGGTYSLKNKETGLLLTLASANLVGSNDTVNGAGNRNNTQLVRLARVDLLADGIYTIATTSNAGIRVEVSGGSAANNTKIVLGKASSAKSQVFQLVRVGGVGSGIYRIRTASSGGWLTETTDKSGGKNPLVKQVGTSKTAASAANTWEVCWNGEHWSLRNRLSGRVLAVADGKVAAGIQLRDFKANGKTNQHFEFAPTTLVTSGYYYIRSAANKKVLTVNKSSYKNGGNIVVGKNDKDVNQKFQLKKVGSYFTITNFFSTKNVQTKGASKKSGANVQQWAPKKNNKNQLWDVQIADGGGLLFVNVNSRRVLHVGKNNNVTQEAVDSSKNQSWSLIATKVNGWYRQDNHWRYRNSAKKSRFDQDINSSGEKLGHYDVLHDIWMKIKNKRSKTKYLIASSWDCCYVAIFEGRKGHWEPIKGFNCGNGSPGVIESKVRDKNPGSSWRWSPVWDRYLALSNTRGRMPELPPENSWARKLGTTFKTSRVLRVNAHEKYFTSVSWTLGYHTYLNSKRELGRHLSNGCQRLQPKYAKWIYQNIRPGTRCTQIRTRNYA